MQNELTKTLSQLKPFLIRGDYKRISEKLKNISADDVKKVFNGQLFLREKVLKIINATQALIKERKLEDSQVKKQVEESLAMLKK